ncbi:MAG: hypothetical protein Phog2KO_33490 [Phototrophicaceae bacterium]
MKKLAMILIVLILLVPMSFAQDDNEITWTLVSEEAVSPNGSFGEWNSRWNEPGAAIYYEGQYHLFVNGYPSGIGSNNGIGYRVSDDGINYEWATEDPLLRRDDFPNEPLSIAANDVIVLDDGTWVLYFHNFNSSNWPRIRGTLGRATAPAPSGPWTIDEDLILVQGEDGSWDDASVAYASVTQVEDSFVMYYVGGNSTGLESVGRATSEDGIVWIKDAEPVLVPNTEAGEPGIFIVTEVIFDGEQWIMAYKSHSAGVGFAFSEDGVTWERYPDNPIILSTDVQNLTAIGFISFIEDDEGNNILFIEGNNSSSTQVYAVNVVIPD